MERRREGNGRNPSQNVKDERKEEKKEGMSDGWMEMSGLKTEGSEW